MKTNRTKILFSTFYFCFLLVIGRLFYWQIIKAEDLKEKAISQTYSLDKIPPVPGLIISSDGFPLSMNQPSLLLSIYKPDLKSNIPELIDTIKSVKSNLSASDLDKLQHFQQNQSTKWISLNSSFSPQESQKLIFPGLSFSQTFSRFYPENKLAKPLLNGLEVYYSKQLQGRGGFSRQAKDATNLTVLSKKIWQLSPINGLNLQTSIHRGLQHYAEAILQNGIEKYSADSGEITILQPQTGEVLAMASSSSAEISPIISALYEPGSIFKPLVVAIALETKSISPGFICSKCNQAKIINGHAITNWDNSTHPNSLLKDIIKNSDNIGMSYIMERIPSQNFLQFFSLLGLDYKTGIDLVGEAKPVVKSYWPEIDLITSSFGQSFAATQIQIIQAFNALANDGYLIHPKIVEYFFEGSKKYSTKINNGTKIFSFDTISEIKSILKYATQQGVVARFNTGHLDVCGKSGTAQVALGGKYTDITTASYIGFSPCDHPKFTMIVTIHNPKTSPWGSSTAAPLWFELADIASYLL